MPFRSNQNSCYSAKGDEGIDSNTNFVDSIYEKSGEITGMREVICLYMNMLKGFSFSNHYVYFQRKCSSPMAFTVMHKGNPTRIGHSCHLWTLHLHHQAKVKNFICLLLI